MKNLAKSKSTFLLLFLLSFFSTLIIAFVVFLLTFKADNTAVGANIPDVTTTKTVLLCDIDNNNSYTVTVDFKNAKAEVSRLYIDNSVYSYSGKSGLLKEARKKCPEIGHILALSETQFCAAVDYLGGYPVYVTPHISELCGGISQGNQKIVGVSLINIFKQEKNNRELALNAATWLCNGWCKRLSDKRTFFRLIDLSDCDISYTDYYPYIDKFKVFVDN